MPDSSGTKLVRYSPSRVTVHSTGTSVVLPDGEVIFATTRLSFTSTYAESRTSTDSLIGSPGSTRSDVVETLTCSGTPSTSQRMRRRQNIACVVSATGTLASMRQMKESWIGIAGALPLP